MKPEIIYEDFEKLDLRVGKVLEVGEIDGADKLYKLTVDLGSEIGERIICAGVKEFYSVDELKGKQVVIIVNLAPRILKGVTSEGMLLAVSENGKPTLLIPEECVEEGSGVR